jgi:hypothetical protein
MRIKDIYKKARATGWGSLNEEEQKYWDKLSNKRADKRNKDWKDTERFGKRNIY